MNFSKGEIIHDSSSISFQYDRTVWTKVYSKDQEKACSEAYLEILKNVTNTSQNSVDGHVSVIFTTTEDSQVNMEISENVYKGILSLSHVEFIYLLRFKNTERKFEAIGGITRLDFLKLVDTKYEGKVFIGKHHFQVKKFNQKSDIHVELFLGEFPLERIKSFINTIGESYYSNICGLIQKRIQLLSQTKEIYSESENSSREKILLRESSVNLESISNERSGNPDIDCCEYCLTFYATVYFLVCTSNQEVKKWWLESEIDLLKFKLENDFPTRQHIEHVIKENKLLDLPLFQKVDPSEYERLNKIWLDVSLESEPPDYWVCSDYFDLIEVIPQSTFHIENGKVYMCYHHFKSVLIPFIVKSRYEELLKMDVEPIEGMEEGLEILRSQIINVQQYDRKWEAMPELPPIEQAHSHFPLCQFIPYLNMKKGDFKHLQRGAFSVFLADVGYDKTTISNYIKRNLKDVDSKKTDSRRNEMDVWLKVREKHCSTKKTPLFGKKCENLLSGHSGHKATSHEHSIYCPLKFYDQETLRHYLYEFGFTNQEIIERIVKYSKDDPMTWCSKLLRYKMSGSSWSKIKSPPTYFLRSRRHIQIEYEK